MAGYRERSGALRRRAGLIAGLALTAASSAAQQAEREPSLPPVEATAVTLDVVVLDGSGNPVTGLGPGDFEVIEDGRSQLIVGFEARDLTSPRTGSVAPEAGITNVRADEETGRVLALLIDDLGIGPATLQQVKPALASWIRKRALDRDEITIVTTSGDRWWSDSPGRGRDGLVATLESATSKFGRLEPDQWRRRAEAAFGAIQRLAESLSGFPGRKSILFVSEWFVDDRSIDAPFRATVEATRRANTAVYYLSAGGLAGTWRYRAENGTQPRPGRGPATIANLEGLQGQAGGRNLAEATGGGALTPSNDLATGLERMARESSAYYLLGYEPQEAPDGRWHDLEVRVARDGVKVRARRSYRASRSEDLAQAGGQARREDAEGGDERASKRPLAPALLTGSVRAGLPLRLAAFVGRPSGEQATVQIVIEVDNSHVHVNRTRTPWRALLDLTVLAARVGDAAALVPVDERLDLSLGPGDVDNGWWMVARETPLPPGEWQIRAWVRDLGSGESGLLTQHLSVPAVEHTYLSTLKLSDRFAPPAAPGELPRLVPSTLRRFGPRGDIVCQYEVFSFGGRGLAGVPRLEGGYTLQREGDGRARIVAPTPIERAGERAVRLIRLPLRELEDGRYTIAVTVRDTLAQRTLTAQESFVLSRESDEEASKR